MDVEDQSGDELIIRELLSFQRVQVVADVQWDNLQSFLLSICSRISVQASRLDKYEEQEKCLANSVNELGELCKNTIEEVKEAKVGEDKKKEDWAKMIENQIQRLQEGLDATSNSMNQQTNNFTGLQNGMEILQSLPQRVNSLEEIIKNAPNKYIKQEANGEGTCGKGDSGDGDAQQGAANGEDKGEILGDPFETLQADLEEHNDRLHLIEEQIGDLKELLKQTTKAHASDYEALQKICRNLRSEFEMKPILDVKSTNHSGDIPTQEEKSKLEEAILELQNRLQRKADNESVDLISRLAHKNKDQLEKLKSEFKIQAKSPLQSSRRGSSGQESQPKRVEASLLESRVKKVEDDLIALATQLAGKAERTEIDNLQFQVGLFGTNHHGSYGIYELDSDGSHGYDTVQTHHRIGTVPSIDSEIASELLNPATQNHGHSGMDDEPAERSPDNSSIRSPTQSRSKPLAVDLSDSASIDPDESDSQSGGELITLSRKQSQSKFGSQTCRESGIPNVALQKLQELIGKKADRDEVRQLHEMINRQRITPMESNASYADIEALQEEFTELKKSIDDLNDGVESLRERSDLSVLISKRIENLSEPPATIQDARHVNEVLQVVINDHAQRLMEYGDILLQIEVLLAAKADASGLEGLKELLAGFQNRMKTRMESMRASAVNDQKQGSVLSLSGNYPRLISNSSQAKLESYEQQLNQLLKDVEMLGKGHEQQLNQLFKDVEILGKGLLIMSGHQHGLMNQDSRVCEELQSTSNNSIAEANEDMSNIATVSNKQKIGSRFNTLHTNFRDQDTNDFPDSLVSNIVHGDNVTPKTMLQNVFINRADGSPLLVALEGDLRDNKLKSKGDSDTFAKLVEDFQHISSKIEQIIQGLEEIQGGLDHKADKVDLQKVARYVKQRVERAETAMLSGKALGFKCMSCDHPLDNLNPNRAEFLPTNFMPKQTLPMSSAERLYAHERESGDSTRTSTSGSIDGTSLLVDVPRSLSSKLKHLKGKKP